MQGVLLTLAIPLAPRGDPLVSETDPSPRGAGGLFPGNIPPAPWARGMVTRNISIPHGERGLFYGFSRFVAVKERKKRKTKAENEVTMGRD